MYAIHRLSPVAREYLEKGRVIQDVSSRAALDWIQSTIAGFVRLNVKDVACSDIDLLNQFHEFLPIEQLNEFRVSLIQHLNDLTEFREKYFELGAASIIEIAGSELVMQKRVNLSIQLPDDESSLLPIHADTWSGDSPYELVAWVPLVDCFETKSMYIYPGSSKELGEIDSELFNGANRSADDLFATIKDRVEWLRVDYGQLLIFDQALPHGNVVNVSGETRWSMNCRFKNTYSPYGDKKLGEFFEPISVSPASLRGMDYRLPVIK